MRPRDCEALALQDPANRAVLFALVSGFFGTHLNQLNFSQPERVNPHLLLLASSA